MRRPRVLLDCDGVLSDCAGGMLREAAQLFGINPDVALMRQWDVCKSLGLTQAQEDMVYRQMDRPEWAYNLEVLPGSQEAIKRIEEIADVYIVTAPVWSSPTWDYDRRKWLLHHFNIGYKRVMIGHAKFMCRGDLFVDDKPSTVHAWKEEHPTDEHLGLVWHYDYTYNDHKHLIRVTEWAHLIRHVESMVSR